MGFGKPKNDYWKASLSATYNCLVRFLGKRDHWTLYFMKTKLEWLFRRMYYAIVPHKWRNHRSFAWKVSRPNDFSKRRLQLAAKIIWFNTSRIFTFSSWMRRYWFYVKNDFRNFHQIFTFWDPLSQKKWFLRKCLSVCL